MSHQNKAKYDYEFVNLLLADTSNKATRIAVCSLFSLAGPVIALVPIFIKPELGWNFYFSLASPLTGLCGSFLWLAWPWIRTDNQNNVILISRLRENEPVENSTDSNREVDSLADAIGDGFSRHLDKIEKQSYLFVGITLFVSFLFSVISIVAPILSDNQSGSEISNVNNQISILSKIIKDHTSEIGAQQKAILELSTENAALKEQMPLVSKGK